MTKRGLIRVMAIFAAIIALFVLYIEANKRGDAKTINDLKKAYFAALKDSSSTWLNYKNTCYVYLYRGGGIPNSKLATFDMDDTLTTPKSDAKLPRNATDWQYLFDSIKTRIEQVTRGGRARFIIFTNQQEIAAGETELSEIQKRIELVVQGIGVPCLAFMATEENEFLKPETGMFRLFERSFKGPVKIDYEQSFFCGNANGDPPFDDSDLKFAQAVGLPFLTPNDFFVLNKALRLTESNQNEQVFSHDLTTTKANNKIGAYKVHSIR